MKLVKQKLIEVVDYSKGKKPKNLGDESPQRNLPYIDIKAFEKNIVNQYASEEKVNICKPDDSLVVWDGARFGLTGFGMSGVVGSTIMKLSPKSFINPKLLFLFLQSKYLEINKNPKGVGIPHVNPSFFWNIEITYPEDKESQQQIVDKIEELFSVVDSVAESLTYVKKATTNLGNKLLFDSFTGKLTEDWRNTNKVMGTGSELVKKYTQNLITDTSLPNTWAKVRVGDIFGVYVGSTPSRKEKSYWGGDIPWVSSGEVSFCRIKETKETITQLGYDNSSTKIHPIGTVLLGMIGEGKTRGQVAILDIEATHNQNSAAIRVSETGVLPEYVYYYFQSEYQKTRQIGSGNNQKALNKTRVSEIEIPIPPVEEQQVIVDLLGEYFSNLEAIKKDLDVSKKVKIQSLRQSILKQAFEGKLV